MHSVCVGDLHVTVNYMKVLERKLYYQFLGAFAKLRKATISFVMSVCPVRRHGTTGLTMDGFHEI
jgi:hypothetical protein